MSRSNRGVVIMVAGGIALGAAFAIVYATVIEPNRQQSKAQAEVSAWGERWLTARACLVGDDAKSTDPTEAYVARELLDPEVVAKVRECLEPLKRLRREQGDSSGDRGVELAWSDLKTAIGKIGKAHALRAATERQASEATLRADMGDGIAAVDAAYQNLRDKAGMKPAEMPGGSTLPSADKTVVLAERATYVQVLNNVVLVQGVLHEDPPSEYVARIDRIDPTDDARRPREPLAVTSDRGPIWGVWLDPGDNVKSGDGLSAGPLDDRGAPAGVGVRVVTVAPGAGVSSMYATGAGNERIVVYRVQSDELDPQIRIARSEDAGATWKDIHALPPSAHLARSESLARADITWLEAGRLKWLPIRDGALASLQPVDVAPESLLGMNESLTACFGETATWWILERSLVYVTAEGKATPVPSPPNYMGGVVCDDRHLVEMRTVLTDQDMALHVTRCRPTACDQSMSIPMPRDSLALAALGPEHGLSVIVATNGVVSLWSGKTGDGEALEHRELFSAPAAYGLVEWKGVRYVISESGGFVRATALAD